jgi:hypothetical protein
VGTSPCGEIGYHDALRTRYCGFESCRGHREIFIEFMKKLFLTFLLLLLISVPALAFAESFTPLVQCGNAGQAACTLTNFFETILRVYKFTIYIIALPLAGILIMAGGIYMIISAGNPGTFEKGKNLVKVSIIALCIIFGSWLIINTVLLAIGYTPEGGGNWWSI